MFGSATLLLLAAALCLWPSAEARGEPPCAMEDSVEIRKFELFRNGSLLDAESRILYPPSQHFRLSGVQRGCACALRRCIRKCCPPDQHFLNESKDCRLRPGGPSGKAAFDAAVFGRLLQPHEPPLNRSDFVFVYGLQGCAKDSYRLEPDASPDDNFTLLADGYLQQHTAPPVDASRYCVEYFEDKKYISAIICFPEEVGMQDSEALVFTMFPIGMLLSCVFMALTLMVYVLLPELRNLHGKCLMCHVACLLAAYLSLSIVQLGTNVIPGWLCSYLPFVIQFTFSAAFFWLNIMCFDICWMFNRVRTISGSSVDRERKKLLIYSSYAWGCPLALLVVCLVVELAPDLPAYVPRPRFGQHSCWYSPFGDKLAVVLYFFGPISVLLMMNVVLFGRTAVRIVGLRRGTGMLKRNADSQCSQEKQQNFVLYLKLFVVMGLSWIMEVVSLLVRGPTYMWIVTDVCNTLQGLAIFLIFVWKPKVRDALRKRLWPTRPSAASSQLSVATNLRKLSSNTRVEQIG